ncbi:hypothetical protein [Burkholderia ubonensis]|uniref:hypothetical protein n=1 Tax=Burkholderia ubonensis TaxID=101571 RepID=UPI0012FA21F1|nr:hypothetical protein [Burkholderia ubonensis]
MTTENEKSPAPKQASEAATTTAATDLEVPVTAEAIVEQQGAPINGTCSKFSGTKSRADAPASQRYSWATTGMKRDPEGSFVFASDARVMSSRADALTDRIKAMFAPNPSGEFGPSDEPESQYRFGYNTALEDVLSAIAASPVEQPAGADERAECIAWVNANGFTKYHESMCAAWEERARRAVASPAAEAVAIPVAWDQDAAIEALSDFPKGSIWYEFLEEVGFDPTSGPNYVLTVQGRAMLDQLKSAYFATPQPPAQTDAREALADERYEAILAAAEDVLEYRKRVYAAGTNTEALARQAEKTLRFLLAAHPGQTGPRAEVANDEVVSACEAHGIALPVEALDAATALVNLFAARAGERQ